MADMNPELAFLNAQKDEYDPTVDYAQPAPADDDEGDDEEEYDPAAYPVAGASTPSDQSASMPESAANTPPPATDEALKPPAIQASAAAATPSKQPPRTKGGFVDESEDEDEVPVSKATGSALLNADGVSDAPQRSLTNTPSNTLAPSNVPVHSAQHLGHSGVSSSTSVPNNDAAPPSSSAVPNGGMPVPDITKTGIADALNTATARPSTAPITPAPSSLTKQRLPQDRIGIFEDRIADDPRGDIEAWLSLIEEHRRRHKFDDARAVYDRFFNTFPSFAEQWVEYIRMESELEELKRVELLFQRCIGTTPHVGLWQQYINHVRRVNNVSTDPNARTTITQVYEFVTEIIGIDVSSGSIWVDYIEFVKSGPGVVGGQGWQDMQKMDNLRKVYQRAIAVPTNATLDIWREYDRFEMGLNKVAGRKNLQEKSPFYMTARSANNVLENVTRGIIRTTMPKLPPVLGFEGHDDYMTQVRLWKSWIRWEKDDPLDLQDGDRATYNKRIIYLYKQALMPLRFWPGLWYEAAEWCFLNDLETDGNWFLEQGVEANPESCLLAFQHAHQIELKPVDEGEAGVIRKGEAVRAPFNKVLDELYELTNKTKKREEFSLARAKEAFAAQQAAEELAARKNENDEDDEDDTEANVKRQKEKEAAFQTQLQAISAGYNGQIMELKRMISYAWIALMRTMRRVQGKGRPDAPKGTPPGFRGIFAEARKKGKLLSDAYVASALIEHHCYQDPAATKIFDRGMKLFPDDEQFALEYIKHLVKQNDATNARAVFETVVNRLTQKPDSAARAKPLFLFFHEYESRYGELTQIVKLEKRMNDLFPEDPQLARFAQRFSTPTFDPTTVRPIISPKVQMKPVMLNMPPAAVVPSAFNSVLPTVEEPAPVPQIPERRPSPPLNSYDLAPALVNSPKRPFADLDDEIAQPRKLARGESPLKGAAGRRLVAARGGAVRPSDGFSHTPVAPTPMPLPREINFLLSIIPSASIFNVHNGTKFIPEEAIALLRALDLSQANLMPPQTHTPVAPPVQPPMGQPMMGYWGPPPPQGYYGH